MPLWSVTYFNNLDLSGDAVLTSESDSVGHYWGLFRPDGVDDAFSVRWQRRLELDAETYRIFVWSRDGIRIRINDVVVLEEWTSGPLRQNEVVVGVVDGTFDLDVEHFSTGGLDDIFVWWVPTDSEGWLGSYWPNPALEGSPELVQEDEAVSFDWGISSPIPGYTNGPFSARWSQTLPLDEGLYRFSVNFDDGARVYLDGNLIIDDWQQGFRRDAVGELWVSEGMHEVVVEYFERQGDASIELNWEKLPDFTGGWLAEIYPNPWLSGNPIHQSLGNILDFQWESGSPLPQIPHDQFSVRWVRQFFFEPGLYQIKVMSDDGVRLFINDELILDEWHNSNFSELHELVVSLEATQLIEIHYYEDSGSAVFRMSIERLGPLVE